MPSTTSNTLISSVPVNNNYFGFGIDNLDKVFKYYPQFYLDFASLCIKGNTLVYKRQLTGSAYRQLIVYCENNEINYVTYEYCSGFPWDGTGKCSQLVTYKHFTEMCAEASLCLSEIDVACYHKFMHYPVFTFKDYDIKGLTVKFLANEKIRCEFLDQFLLFAKDGQVLVASEFYDKMPSTDALKKIIAGLSTMSENFSQTSNKPLTITFTEQ